jgi:hypothetical protein
MINAFTLVVVLGAADDPPTRLPVSGSGVGKAGGYPVCACTNSNFPVALTCRLPEDATHASCMVTLLA